MFVKVAGKVQKMEEVVEWESKVRPFVLAHPNEATQIEVEGFNSKGTAKKVYIVIDPYHLEEELFDMVLRTEEIGAVHACPPVGSQTGRVLMNKNQNGLTV